MEITIDDFHKVEIKIGEIVSAESIEGSEKLLRLKVNFGEEHPRQILSGIAKFIKPEDLIGVKCPFVTNLAPRQMMGEVSEAMIMAASAEGGIFTLLRADKEIPAGIRVK